MSLIEKTKQHLITLYRISKALKMTCKAGGCTQANIGLLSPRSTLAGKKILITGGSSGIGLSIAKKCVSEGACVVITGRDQDKLIKAMQEVGSENLDYVPWDISDIKNIPEKLGEISQKMGGEPDALVNNAGILDIGNFPEIDENEWDKVYLTNSKGLFFTTQCVCKSWLKSNNTKIRKVINISSQGGYVGATYPYRMTKWDVAGLTQGLGIKMAPHQIIVNGIAPGVVATGMQQKCLEQGTNLYYSDNPLKRFALPEEIAELAVFMLSDACNFIVGQTLVCDGGYSIK